MTLGAEVRRRRTALGLTLDELAERSGLSPHYLSTLENGKRDPHLSTIVAVARGLRVAPAELLAGGDNPDTGTPVGAFFERAPVEAQEAVETLLRLVVAGSAPRRRHRRRRHV